MISLRDLTENDRDRLRFWRNMPEVRRWMLSDHVIDEVEHARWFEGSGTDDTKKYWVIMKDDQPVGCANLTRIDLNRSCCDWALYVAEPEIRGKGAGQAAGFLMQRFVFENLGLERLSCEVLGSNEASLAMHEFLGFRREGLLRKAVIKNGVRHDVVLMAVLKNDWSVLRSGLGQSLRSRGLIHG